MTLIERSGNIGALVVSAIMGPPFPTVDIDLPLKAVVSLLEFRPAVLSVDNAKVVGIITNSDIGRVLLTRKE